MDHSHVLSTASLLVGWKALCTFPVLAALLFLYHLAWVSSLPGEHLWFPWLPKPRTGQTLISVLSALSIIFLFFLGCTCGIWSSMDRGWIRVTAEAYVTAIATPDPEHTKWGQGSNPHPNRCYVVFLTSWATTGTPGIFSTGPSTCSYLASCQMVTSWK